MSPFIESEIKHECSYKENGDKKLFRFSMRVQLPLRIFTRQKVNDARRNLEMSFQCAKFISELRKIHLKKNNFLKINRVMVCTE